ncbi:MULTISPECIES: hypothetical protein [Salmonella]|uniref:Uncharacterized protein n=1 Tax=Salmonella enterica I TaxID=59201 RepID=A0A379VX10_SALET|nr:MULTISPECIES: hypothetical protein [Salmonella]EKH3528639.1 hypothetical protein [Salmonella enterica subsp. enterica]ESG27781.1 hypothetical protein SEEMEL47_06358 [Salmonella enterica subsp. enterica serovar Meleagridis str. 0047]MCL9617635.1 hypothetical protein [Salmonella enterica subsp. enterica serovar Enteritidis]EHT5603834.1 hypothetical protein [Salmonella enterica subsp. enterica serovar Meleagridis]EIM0668272.1 hypothetical protein [Salmonella enterica subsp. enterica serovar Me
MLPHKILQEWLTLDEAAEVIRQHNITLLPADLIRHALTAICYSRSTSPRPSF